MPEAGRATVKFVGDYSALMGGLTSSLAPGKLKSAGLKAGAAIGAGFAVSALVSEVSKAVTVTKDFDKQLSSLQAVSGSTGKQLETLRKQAIDMGAATVFSASEAAKAQVELAKGGLSASQILGGSLKSSLDLAAAGELELAAAAETVVNAMQLFGLEGRDTVKIADMLATAANRTTADVEDFAMALKQGGSVAKLAGYNLNDTVVVLEALAEAGIKNSDAGTSMKAAFLQLVNPTKKQSDLAKQLGINWLTQNGELKNAIGLSRELRKATDGMTKAERAKTLGILAGQDGIRTLNALYAAGEGTLRRYARANREQGTAAETAKTKTDNLAGDVEELSGAYETLQIQVGTLVTPALRELTQTGTDVLRWMNDLNRTLESTPIGDEGTWKEIFGDAVEFGKAFAQFPIDPDGGIKRFFNALGGDSEEVSRIRATINARTDAAVSLRRVSTIAANARDRARGATVREREAEADLRRARQRFGDGSNEVLRAEVRLQRAKRRTIQLTREAKAAERLEGVERRVVASRTRDQVVQEKSRIAILNRSIRTLGRKWEAEKRNNGNTAKARELEQQIINKLKSRDNTQKRLNNVLADAARQIGPKYAKSLQQINGRQAQFESVLGRLPKKAGNLRSALGQLPGPIEKVGRTSKEQLSGRAKNALEDYAEAVVDKRRQVNSNMRMMPQVQIVATDRMIEDFAAKVGAVKNDGKPQQKRRGGLVGLIQGFRDGGVPVAVSSGELFKTPDGKWGSVPGQPTASDNVLTSMPVGTKVFTFDGQRRLMAGASEGEALRNQLPHFASGGIVKPEVMGGSPKARELANTAIGGIHDKATARLKRIRNLASRSAPGGSWSGGSGQYPGVSGDTDFMPALGQALSAMSRAAGQSISVQSGWRSYAEQAALYEAYLNGTGNLAAPPGSSNHESGRAADITPGSEVFGSLAGRFGMGFTVPGESWHIELLRRGGIVGLLQALYTGGQVKVVKDVGSFLMKRGFNHRAAAGILGNAYREGLWNPSQMEYTGLHNGGLYGFTTSPVSLQDVKNFADRRGKRWDDAILQTNFMLSHGDPTGMALRGEMNAANAIPKATEIFMSKWEKPGVPALGDRVAAAFDASKIMRDAGINGEGKGMSAAEKSKQQRKRRREAREAQVQKLIQRAFAARSSQGKKGAFWQVLDLYAKYGDFGVGKGATGAHGGVMPDGKTFEAVEFLQRASNAASVVNPQRGSGQLYSLVKWLQGNVEMTGVEDANDRLFNKLERVQEKGQNRAKKKRERVLSRIQAKGADYPQKKNLLANDRIIKTADEWIELAARKHQSEGSDGGSEYTDAEVNYEQRLYQSLLGSLRDRKGMIAGSLNFLSVQRGNLEERLKSAPAWRKPALRKALANNRGTAQGLRSGLEELVGFTGQGGRIGDVKASLEELGVRSTVEKQALAGISIGDLLQIVEFAKYGGYESMPKFHGGGVFKAPSGQSEGPALLRNNETVFTPEQTAALGAGDVKVEVNFADGMGWLKEFVDVRVVEGNRRSNQMMKAGVR